MTTSYPTKLYASFEVRGKCQIQHVIQPTAVRILTPLAEWEVTAVLCCASWLGKQTAAHEQVYQLQDKHHADSLLKVQTVCPRNNRKGAAICFCQTCEIMWALWLLFTTDTSQKAFTAYSEIRMLSYTQKPGWTGL